MGRNALIASIVLNVFLLAAVLGLSYGWPLFIHVKQVLPERERRVSFFADFPVRSGDIVFVGDAITDEARWAELFPEAPVKNRGVAGDTTGDVALRIGQIAAGKPRQVFVMVGGGDAAAEKTVAETAASYELILDRLTAESPDTEVFVQSILPRGEEAREKIEQRNAAIREIAEKKGAVYIDLFGLFVGENGAIRGDLSNDHAHLLGAGYQVWRDAVTQHLPGG